MYKIGELSKICKVTVNTLRYYDKENLLIPDIIDSFTGYRYYSASKIEQCYRILALKELGFSLDEIRKHLNANSGEDMISLIEKKQRELTLLLEQISSQIYRLDTMKKGITDGESKMFDIIIRNADTVRVACVRKIFASYDEAYSEAEKIKNSLPKSILGKRTIIVNYETDYKEANFDLAACVEITGKVPKGSQFEEKEIVFYGEAASLACKKEELDDCYRNVAKQLENIPAQITGPFYEIYHEDGTLELKLPVCVLSRTENERADDVFETVFENDEEVIGAWEFYDIILCREQFSSENRKYSDYKNMWLKKMYFLPNGEPYWGIKGWTKNYVYFQIDYPAEKQRCRYTTEKIGNDTYMFLEFAEREYKSRGGKPSIYVFKKADSKIYDKNEIRIKDNVDIPFAQDERILGEWKVCDICNSISNFVPEKKAWKGSLFWQTAEFFANGKVSVLYENRTPLSLDWTKGIVLDKRWEVAQHYEIKNIGGKNYLFVEWKSGDYMWGGKAPLYYVFQRD